MDDQFSIETHGFGEPPHMLTPENPPETVTNMLMIFLHGDLTISTIGSRGFIH
jgi:hypothetical protein